MTAGLDFSTISPLTERLYSKTVPLSENELSNGPDPAGQGEMMGKQPLPHTP